MVIHMKRLNQARERDNFKTVWVLYKKDALGNIKVYYS